MPAAKPLGFTDTATVAGVVPVEGDTVIQLPPDTVATVAVKLTADGVLFTVRF